MPASPICQVSVGGGPWQSTLAGVNMAPGAQIRIKLEDYTDVTAWYLEVIGQDELSPDPTLTGVDAITHLVESPATLVSFTSESAEGRALVFQSTVNTGAGPTLVTRFSLYLLTAHNLRVGATGETVEGDPEFGWSAIVNPAIRLAGEGGGGGTLAGDVTGPSVTNEVSYIKGMSAPDPAGANEGNAIVVEVVADTDPLYSPRAMLSDGTHLYIGESRQTGGGSGTPIVYKVLPKGVLLQVTASVDLSMILGTVDRVRDIAQDATYLYVALWSAEHVAIIDKASMDVDGWCYCGAGSLAISVDTDGLGNVFVYNQDGGEVQKFSVAACLGQPPGTVGPTAVCSIENSRWLCYGGGKVWVVNGGNGGPNRALVRIDAATMIIDGTVAQLDGGDWTFSCLYAFGSVWVSPNSGNVCRVDPSTLAETLITPTGGFVGNRLTFGVGPNSGPSDLCMYVTAGNSGDQNAGIIDPASNTWTTTTFLGPGTDVYDESAGVGNCQYFPGFLNGNGSTAAISVYSNVQAMANKCTFGHLRLAYGAAPITVGGDLGPWTPVIASKQRVVGIDTIPAPLAATFASGRFVRGNLFNYFTSPRAVILDGAEAWVAEHNQMGGILPVIRRISLPDGLLVASVDLTPYGQSGVRDLGQDSQYVYCTCWGEGLVAIISKATNSVVGWGTLPDPGFKNRQAVSVCADGAGNFYVVGWGNWGEGSEYGIFKWATADCIGHNPEDPAGVPSTVVYDAVNYRNLRKIRYFSNYLWIAGGGSGTFTLGKFDPADLSLVVASVETNQGMDVIVDGAFAYVTDNTNNTLCKYSISDCALDSSTALDDGFGRYLNQPDGLALDATSGIIAVTGVGDGNVLLVDAAGMFVSDGRALPTSSFGSMISYASDFYVTGWSQGTAPGVYRVTLAGDSTLIGIDVWFSCSPIDSLQDVPVAATAPLTNQVLKFDGTQWAPGTGGGGGHVTGAVYNGNTIGNDVTDALYLSYSGWVRLPTALADGEVHTITDGMNYAGVTGYYITIYDVYYSPIGYIATNRGSMTFVWSSNYAMWILS
jgi:hypothetical protein